MKIKIIFISVLLSSCYLSEELPPDQTVWEYELPSNVGLNEQSLFDLNNRINNLEFEQIQGLIIIKDNHLVFENYYLKNSRFTINPLSGAGMAITIAAVSIAEEKGLLNLDDKIEDFLPEYAPFFDSDNNKTFITIRHLLLEKSGLPWNSNDFFAMQNSFDWVAFVLDRSLQAPSGLQYNTNKSTGIILAKVIETASGQTFFDFVNNNIFKQLDISTATINQDASGNFDGGFGINLSLMDLTKFGYLMLEGGIWNGRRVIDPNFIEDATGVQTNVSGTYTVGYMWRQFGDNFENALGINHDEIYFITGELGQHLYIIPSQKMVIAIDAENFFFGFGNPSLNLLAEISYMIQ